MKYVHDISGKDIFAEVAKKAIQDEYGNDINETYLKKADLTFQYNNDEEIIGINNSAIAAGQGSIKLFGDDGIYVKNELKGKVIGISAQYATPSDVEKKQDKLTEDQMIDIESIPFKLDKTEFEEVSGTFATKDYVTEKIEDIGSPLVIRGSKTCAEIEALSGMKVGDVYCVKDTGTIHGMSVMVRDEVAWTSDNEWIVVGRENAVDLSDYYKKSETSGTTQLDAAFANVDVKFESYYPMTSTSGATQISEALASKQDSTAMTAYYTKLETSGTQELENKFGTKVDTTAMTAYVDNQYLANNYYDKTETSSKTEIADALSGKVDNEELEFYYMMTETSGADELSAAFNEKLDVTAFNLSSTAWNDTTDVVRANSAAWAEGGAGDPAVNELVHSNSAMWNEVEDKLYTTAFSEVSSTFATDEDLESKADVSVVNGLKNKLDTIEEGAQKNVQSNWTETNTASDAYINNKPDIYTKSEVDTLFNGKIVVVEELPVTGDSSKIYYVGPNSSVSGDDKYDEYLWHENDWLHVGEHSIDLSDYATYEYVDAITNEKQDKLTFGYDGTKLNSINGSSFKDTTYNAGQNIDITNNTISGKDWTTEIDESVEALSEEMAQGFSNIDSTKLDKSAFSDVSGTFLTKTIADGYYVKTGDMVNYVTTSTYDTEKYSWNETYTAVNQNSGKWDSTYYTIDSNSGAWSNATGTLSVESGGWNDAKSCIGSNSGYWVNATNTLNMESGGWNDAKSCIGSNSSKYENTFTAVDTNSSTWNSVSNKQDTIVFGYDSDDKIITINTSAIAGGTSYTGDAQGALDEVYSNSGNWNSTYTTVTNNTAIWNTVTAKLSIDDFNTFKSTADITEYVAGTNIEINAHTISGKNWLADIQNASANAYNEATALIPNMNNYLTTADANRDFQPKGNYLTATALDSYSGTWETVTAKLNISDFNTEISNYATTSNLDYVSGEIETLKTAFANFGAYEVVQSTATIINPNYRTIYLVKDTSIIGDDLYKEYICVDSATPTYEMIGDTSVNLNDYQTISGMTAYQEISSMTAYEPKITYNYNIATNEITGLNGSAIAGGGSVPDKKYAIKNSPTSSITFNNDNFVGIQLNTITGNLTTANINTANFYNLNIGVEVTMTSTTNELYEIVLSMNDNITGEKIRSYIGPIYGSITGKQHYNINTLINGDYAKSGINNLYVSSNSGASFNFKVNEFSIYEI